MAISQTKSAQDANTNKLECKYKQNTKIKWNKMKSFWVFCVICDQLTVMGVVSLFLFLRHSHPRLGMCSSINAANNEIHQFFFLLYFQIIKLWWPGLVISFISDKKKSPRNKNSPKQTINPVTQGHQKLHLVASEV